MRIALLTLPIAATLLSGCEPERGIRGHRDFDVPVDVGCIDAALRTEFDQIQRWDYVSDGFEFPDQTNVAQMAYYQSNDQLGWATLKIGRIGDKTRIVHDFTGMGSELPQSVFPPAMNAMNRANEVVDKACGLSIGGLQMREIGQDVDALN
jgi:hypothetical protein